VTTGDNTEATAANITRPRFDTVRAAVRLAFRAHICRLVPASDVNWLAAANWWHGEGALKDSPYDAD
jgi:hypothetical protein